MNNKRIIKETKKLLIHEMDAIEFKSCSKIYPRTNENINETFKLFDLHNKDILTVLSSGDHLLCGLLTSAKSIDTFDINVLTKYFFELKKAAINTYDFEKYKKIILQNLIENGEITTHDYLPIRENMEDEYVKFWDQIITFCNSNKIKISKLFYPTTNETKLVNYLNNNNYELLQYRLQNTNINFIKSNLTDLHKHLNKKYDYMFLSNIADYLSIFTVKEYSQKKLMKHLNKNGQIIYAYMFDANKTIAKRFENKNIYQVNSSIPSTKDYVLTLKK